MNDDISNKSSPNLKFNDRFGKLIQFYIQNYTLISVHSYVLISIHSYEAFTSFFGNLRIYLELLENDLKTFRKTLSFHQIQCPMSFSNAELNQLSKSVIEFKIW